MTTYVGQKLYGHSGRPIGTVTDVMADPSDLAPEWLAVRWGLLRRDHLIPADAVDEQGGILVTLLDEEIIKQAPVTHDHVPPTHSESEKLRAQFHLPVVGNPTEDV